MNEPNNPIVDVSKQTAKRKRKRPSRSTHRQLGDYDQLFDNLLNVPEAQQLAKEIGYDEASVKAGQFLWKTTHTALETRDIAKGRLQSLVQSLRKLRAEVRAEYMQYRKFVKLGFKDNVAMLKTLDVAGNAKVDQNSLRFIIQTFYNIVLSNEEAKAVLQACNVNEKTLKDAQKKLGELTELEHDREQLASEAKNLTITKNDAIEELASWTTAFRQRARARYFNDNYAMNVLGL